MKRKFAKGFNTARLSPDEAARQGRVSRLAVDALGQSDAVIAFLNAHDEALGGRPIDLAVKSAEGLAAVERALTAAVCQHLATDPCNSGDIAKPL